MCCIIIVGVFCNGFEDCKQAFSPFGVCFHYAIKEWDIFNVDLLVTLDVIMKQDKLKIYKFNLLYTSL